MAFIGDSVARNHVESLLCLLSLVEVPLSTYRDDDDRFRTWHFPENNFTVMVLWTRFLVMGEERIINGKNSDSFDLHLDKLDKNWTSKLPEMDYAIISDVHWFYRRHFLHDNENMIGCIYCSEPNIKSYTVEFALERVIRLVLNYINECKECKSLVTLLRTGSPAHFENGAWNTGGNCNRTSPFQESEISLEGIEWRLRNMQVDEIKRASKVKKKGKRFAILDVTKAMLMRPDGHPDSHWDDKWMKGYKDCVHWCMPGPIDAWNDFLMAVLKRYAPISIPRKISE
ncbi:hypothetical protein MANES_14G015700v8 [Manihot esculenta]|nr:hypothetical protein MANES_14G015700v8 [Manihot esculenta]KAG8638231.1 hypothetical protein MANES_14G015700v8 [Manihot esculenta]KAG8638233.1 hypothetical protein MANES_14G015700v8 [Manihot esculenta]OAY30241.1 hypothetical protein MANES_14G015700v8 [Manihot esculenta]